MRSDTSWQRRRATVRTARGLCAGRCSGSSRIPLSEALIAGGIKERPAFLEVYLDNNQLFYRPILADTEEKAAGLALSTV